MAGPSLWLTTLGCAKNQVDSEKVNAMLSEAGYGWADLPETADVVMVNTCVFIEEARAESVETILDLEDRQRDGAHSVVIGCMAQRFGSEVENALPEVDAVDQVEEGVPTGLSYRHEPEIDGVIRTDGGEPGQWIEVEFTGTYGHDMEAAVR